MKPKSVFLAENTNLEIEEFLKSHQTVYIPVGATEQHGPYRMSKTGTWGDATKATAVKGEQLLEAGVQSVIYLMHDIEKTFQELTIR